jgi:hypothetical protein
MLRLERIGRRAAYAAVIIAGIAFMVLSASPQQQEPETTDWPGIDLMLGSPTEPWQKRIDNCRKQEWRKLERLPRKYFRSELTPSQMTCAAARLAKLCAEAISRSDVRAYLAIQSWAAIERKECANVP